VIGGESRVQRAYGLTGWGKWLRSQDTLLSISSW